MSLHALQNLGEADDDYGEEMDGVGEVGQVDMFGLDEFGMPAGADSLWGAVVGGGLGTGTAIIVRRVTDPGSTLYNYSEALGLLAGGIAGGVMMAFPGSRRMGWAAIAAAFVTNGLRQVESMLFAKKDGDKLTAKNNTEKGAFGAVAIEPNVAMIQPFEGLGQDIDVEELDGYGYGGMGAVDIEPGFLVPGTEPPPGGFGAVTVDPGGVFQDFGDEGYSPYESEQEMEDVEDTTLVGPPQLANAGDYGLGNNPGVAQAAALGGPPVSGLSMHYGATLFGSTQ
jgi:hypothetical protein